MLLSEDHAPDGALLGIGLSVLAKNGQHLHLVTDDPYEATQEHQPDWILAPRLTGGTSTPPSAGHRHGTSSSTPRDHHGDFGLWR